jgi:tRNA(Ile2) C34 agmatinyltransferase TiaS
VKYYELRYREELPGASLNRPTSCMACKSIIRGQGGGGDFICEDCYEVLRSFKVHKVFRDFKYKEG